MIKMYSATTKDSKMFVKGLNVHDHVLLHSLSQNCNSVEQGMAIGCYQTKALKE